MKTSELKALFVLMLGNAVIRTLSVWNQLPHCWCFQKIWPNFLHVFSPYWEYQLKTDTHICIVKAKQVHRVQLFAELLNNYKTQWALWQTEMNERQWIHVSGVIKVWIVSKYSSRGGSRSHTTITTRDLNILNIKIVLKIWNYNACALENRILREIGTNRPHKSGKKSLVFMIGSNI